MNTAKLIDISLPLFEGMITYPGNTALKTTSKKGQAIFSSEILIGSHTGTHIDAPSHVFPDGLTLDKLPLQIFAGKCRVLDFSKSQKSVSRLELEEKDIRSGERILLKTKNSLRGFETFYDNYIFLSGDAAELLAEKKVLLVGIDSLSIKQRGSKDIRPHTTLLAANIPILEGIDLAKAAEGTYTLFTLPLKFIGIDASPARAILMG